MEIAIVAGIQAKYPVFLVEKRRLNKCLANKHGKGKHPAKVLLTQMIGIKKAPFSFGEIQLDAVVPKAVQSQNPHNETIRNNALHIIRIYPTASLQLDITQEKLGSSIDSPLRVRA